MTIYNAQSATIASISLPPLILYACIEKLLGKVSQLRLIVVYNDTIFCQIHMILKAVC